MEEGIQKTKKVRKARVMDDVTKLEREGIVVAPSRVKKVLVEMALNPRESIVVNALLTAGERTKKVITKNEVLDLEGKKKVEKVVTYEESTPIALDRVRKTSWYGDVMDAAEEAHATSIREQYENIQLSNEVLFPKDKLLEYKKQKKAAKDVAMKKGLSFDVEKFNTSFKADFYKDFAAFKLTDSYRLTHAAHELDSEGYILDLTSIDPATGKPRRKLVVKLDKEEKPVLDSAGNPVLICVRPRYDERTRMIALINKTCIRLSGGTRDIIAAYLDIIVEQYTRNGIKNCCEANKVVVQVEHALQQSDKVNSGNGENDFNNAMSTDKFVSTFNNYAAALAWIESKKPNEEGVKVEEAYPDPEYDTDFSIYVGYICDSVRVIMAKEAKTEEDREKILHTNTGSSLKSFCSNVIVEAIFRIGLSLKLSLKNGSAKTVTEHMVHSAVEQIHILFGVKYAPVAQRINEKLKTQLAFRTVNHVEEQE